MENKISREDLQMLSGIIEAYLNRNQTGGSLHIVFDDDNWDRESIKYCHEYAKKENDVIGEWISLSLMNMPDSILKACNQMGWDMGYWEWVKLVDNESR